MCQCELKEQHRSPITVGSRHIARTKVKLAKEGIAIVFAR